MIGLQRCRSPDRMAQYGGWFSAVLLALIVLGFVAFNLWMTDTIRVAAQHAQARGFQSDQFLAARFAASEEMSLEWQYWTQPGPEVRVAHAAAGALLETSLRNALATRGGDGGPGSADDRLVRAVLADHATYTAAVGRLFDAEDAGNIALARQIDTQEVDPALDEIVAAVGAAASAHRQAAATAFAELNTAEDLVASATPVVLATGLAFLCLFALVVRGYQDQVRRSGQRFRSLVQNASDAVAIVDADGTMTYVSPTADRVLRRDPSALEGTNALAMVHPDDAAAARAFLAQASTSSDSITTELRLSITEDDVRAFEVTAVNLLWEAAVRGIVINYRDVSERMVLAGKLKHLAFHDTLTGLPNRALFLDRLEQAIARKDRRARLVAVLFLDFDDFKVVNDSLGHARGDAILAELAMRLQASLRKGETVARFGGDGFTILLDDLTSTDEALAVAERVMASLQVPVVVEGRELAITASIGIALAVPGRTTADALIRNADLAMYRAKGEGRGCYRVFDDGMAEAARDRLDLQKDLHHALEHGEFRVFYQPIVSLADRAIVEFEALVRWDRPDHGLTAPSAFIPTAEETGLIVPLGQWVLDEACRQAAEWRERDPDRPLTMSVNLSARQFQHPTLVADVSATLARTGLAPEALKLELTESVMMKDPVVTALALGRLKALGIRIAIDDFGTGYSSLSYLRQFPIDTLKIDRSFVTDLGHDPQSAAIAKNIVTLARTLHVGVTAEGVETSLQEAVLRRIGCDLAQGYLFGYPMPASEAGLFEVGSSKAPRRTA